ncbi:MAG: hypothetical protein HXY52_10355 [Nitrospirae bacterium]|jgi:hypothetical protein|nr:hypothetical protein [Nitrospirota bacterium]
MGVAFNYKKEILNITRDLPNDKLKVLVNFAQFLKAKEEEFSYTTIPDSAAYIRALRKKQAKKVRTGKRFIAELIEWQKSNSL